jgi:hypothetical protein
MLAHYCPRYLHRVSLYTFSLCVILAPVLALRVHSLKKNCLVVDEGRHLLSGLRAWNEGVMNMYYVNPPLIRLLTSLPVYLSRPRYPQDMRNNDAVRQLTSLSGGSRS